MLSYAEGDSNGPNEKGEADDLCCFVIAILKLKFAKSILNLIKKVQWKLQ